MFKEQRFRNSDDLRAHLEAQNVKGQPYSDGRRNLTRYDLPDEPLDVPDGEIGPALNMWIVTLLSCAGLLALFIFFLVQ